MRVVGAGLVEVGTALVAQPRAIWLAKQGRGKHERERVACPPTEIDNAVPHVRRGEVLGPSRLRDLARVDLKRRGSRLQAAHAWARQGRLKPQSQHVAVARGARYVKPHRYQRGLDGI